MEILENSYEILYIVFFPRLFCLLEIFGHSICPRKIGKGREIRDFLEKVGKVREGNFDPCNFLTSIKKQFARRNVCSWIVYNNQFYIWCCYLYLVLRWFNIVNSFYFNLSEVAFHLNQERKLHAINCIVFCFCFLCCPLVFELHLCHIGLGMTCAD